MLFPSAAQCDLNPNQVSASTPNSKLPATEAEMMVAAPGLMLSDDEPVGATVCAPAGADVADTPAATGAGVNTSSWK